MNYKEKIKKVGKTDDVYHQKALVILEAMNEYYEGNFDNLTVRKIVEDLKLYSYKPMADYLKYLKDNGLLTIKKD